MVYNKDIYYNLKYTEYENHAKIIRCKSSHRARAKS